MNCAPERRPFHVGASNSIVDLCAGVVGRSFADPARQAVRTATAVAARHVGARSRLRQRRVPRPRGGSRRRVATDRRRRGDDRRRPPTRPGRRSACRVHRAAALGPTTCSGRGHRLRRGPGSADDRGATLAEGPARSPRDGGFLVAVSARAPIAAARVEAVAVAARTGSPAVRQGERGARLGEPGIIDALAEDAALSPLGAPGRLPCPSRSAISQRRSGRSSSTRSCPRPRARRPGQAASPRARSPTPPRRIGAPNGSYRFGACSAS